VTQRVTRRTWHVDVAVTASVATVTALDLSWSAPGTRTADGLSYALLGGSLVAVLLRRRTPVLATVACAAVLTAWTLLGHRGELLNLALLVGLYTVAVQGNRRRTVVVGSVVVAWSALLGLHVNGRTSAPVTEMLWPFAALLLGEVVRGRRELRHEYADREARAAVQREREADDRARQERLRIAREVHDVVAHTMAAVNVQMGVAAAAFDRDPVASRRALDQARQASREALGELRAAVALLRDDAADAHPAPRLGDLPRLIAQTRAAGIAVTLNDRALGEPGRRLPGIVETTAYRIVQEALTNVVKHSRATTATVTVDSTSDGALTVEVVDDGVGPQGGTGFGHPGMVERAAMVGGRVETGPGRDGGFRVHAVLPVEVDDSDGDG
jgi:signal transduction histidine kinase